MSTVQRSELPGGVNGEITEDRPRHSLLSNGHVGVPVLCRPGG